MYERDPKRAESLISFVKAEIADYANGITDGFTPTPDLSEMFNYSVAYINKLIGISDIREQKKNAQLNHESLPFNLNENMVWLIGYLSASSTPRVSGNNSSSISISESIAERREKVESLCRQQLKIEPKIHVKHKWGKDYHTLRLYDASVQRKLNGLLAREKAPKVIREKYTEILNNPVLTWKFIEGLYEAKGSSGDNAILFTGNNVTYAIFVTELLSRVGVLDAKIQFTDSSRKEIAGVAVRSFSSLKKIAQNIHSVHPKSQGFFEKFKTREYRQHSQPTETEILDLFINAMNVYGSIPSLKKFGEYLKQLDLGISESTVVRILGKGSYKLAREKLKDHGNTVNLESKDCIHRWIIETPHGTSTVEGKCKNCGSTRDFRASMPEIEAKEYRELSIKPRLMERNKREII